MSSPPQTYHTLAWLPSALTALFLYGFGQGLVKKYVDDVSPARFCLLFMVARSVVMLGYFLSHPHDDPFLPQARTFLAVTVGAYMLDGLAWVLYYQSIRIGPITIVGTLSAAYPALTVLLASVFLHEVLTPTQLTGVLLVLGGCAGLSYSPPDPDQPGGGRGWIPLALAALVFWGTAQTLLKYSYGLPRADETNAMLSLVLGGWVTLGAYGLLYGRMPRGHMTHAEWVRQWRHSSVPMGMMAGGDAAVIVATRYGPVSIVAPLTAAYPVVTIAFARLALHEKITRLQYFSVGCTLAGMYLTL